MNLKNGGFWSESQLASEASRNFTKRLKFLLKTLFFQKLFMSILGTTGGPKFIESCAWTLGTHLGWLIVSPETSSHTFLNIQINYDRNYVAVWPPKSTQFGGRIFIWSTVFLRNKTSFKWTFFQKKMVSYGMRIIKFIFFECGPPKKAKYSPNESIKIGKSCITVLTTLSQKYFCSTQIENPI